MAKSLFVDGVPKAGAMALQQAEYFYAGQLMASSLLQSGPTPNLLSNWTYSVIVNSDITSSIKTISVDAEFLNREDILKVS